MKTTYNRREFIKLTSAAAIGGIAFLSGFSRLNASNLKRSTTRIIPWDGPGGEILPSADYAISIKSDGNTYKPFVYYTYNRTIDKEIDAEGLYKKNSFLSLHANQYVDPKLSKDTYAHSWSHFDFEGGPVEVEIKISSNVEGITLPLTSCGIFPSYLGIVCNIVSNDTVRFTLDKPVKIAIVPNYLEARERITNGKAVQAFAGYRNPFFLFARAPEINIPDKNASGTLLIKPGAIYTQADFDKAILIYFEKGVHDYSRFTTSNPDNYMVLKSGQTMYLEGGAYVYGHVTASSKMLIKDMPILRGRGTMSGQKNIWTGNPSANSEIRWVKTEGINYTDANNHMTHSCAPIADVAVVGAWHGNTDGLTVENPSSGETYSGYNVDDCFVMAADTNLKFNGSAKVRNYTVWQLSNAETFLVNKTSNSSLDGLYIICHNSSAKQHFNMQVPASYNNKNLHIKNIISEAPFIGRLFLIQSDYTGAGVAFENVVLENITINTQKIISKSSIGRGSASNSAFGKLIFRNLVINGIKVTNQNCTDYFNLLQGLVVGTELVFE